MQKIGLLEIFLMQILAYTLLWIWDDFAATLVSSAFFMIMIFILIVSLIAEILEPSKVPKWYFKFMGISILAPCITALIFVIIFEGKLEWMEF